MRRWYFVTEGFAAEERRDTSHRQGDPAVRRCDLHSGNRSDYGNALRAIDGAVEFRRQLLRHAAAAAPTSAALIAFDALNYPNELYSSTNQSGDTPGYGIKFSSPVVAKAKVYISTGTDLVTVSNPRGEIDIYG